MSLDPRSKGVSGWPPTGGSGPCASERVRYAVVGLGVRSQTAILPAFGHARSHAELVALVSGDAEKLQLFGRKYRVKHLYDYHGYEDCLASGEVDAVYVALPNNQHREFTVRAARAGVHVLCDMPMAVDVEEADAMIAACRATNVKLMVGYRCSFDEANRRARELVRSGRLGEIRAFHASVSAAPAGGARRWDGDVAGGALVELGIDCIHAAREFFEAEPVEVTALSTRLRRDGRVVELDEALGVVMRFPRERIASFTCSARSMEGSSYEVQGSEGSLRLEQPFSLTRPMVLRACVKGRTREKVFRRRDAIAPQIAYFADCILAHREPMPTAAEGLRDLRVVEALRRAVRTRQSVTLDAAVEDPHGDADPRVIREAAPWAATLPHP